MSANLSTHYTVLGVPSDADLPTIKKAFKTKSLNEHPDRVRQHNPNNEKAIAAAESAFKAVSEAYEVLSDPAKRKNYDASLLNPTVAASATATATSEVASKTSAAASNQAAQMPVKVLRNSPFYQFAVRNELAEILNADNIEGFRKLLNVNRPVNSEDTQIVIATNPSSQLEKSREQPSGEHRKYFLLNEACKRGALKIVKFFHEEEQCDFNDVVLAERYVTHGPALYEAALAGKSNVVKYLADNGANVNSSVLGRFPIFAAVSAGDLESVKCLYDKGACTLFSYDGANYDILVKACESKSPNRMAVLEYLTEKIREKYPAPLKFQLVKAAIQSGDPAIYDYLNGKFNLDKELQNLSPPRIKDLVHSVGRSANPKMFDLFANISEFGKTVFSDPGYGELLFDKCLDSLRNNGVTLLDRQNALKFIKFLLEDKQFTLDKSILHSTLGLDGSRGRTGFMDISMNAYLLSWVCDPKDKDFFRDLSKKCENTADIEKNPEIVSTFDLIKLFNGLTQYDHSSAIRAVLLRLLIARKITYDQLAKMCAGTPSLIDDALRFCAMDTENPDNDRQISELLKSGANPHSKSLGGQSAVYLAETSINNNLLKRVNVID